MRRTMSLVRVGVGLGVLAMSGGVGRAHDVTTKVTWHREVSRIVYARCATCHRPGGRAFSLLTYQEASPWGKAIRDAVLRRTMPPWGAVKGFGSFRNEQTLTQEEIGLVETWVGGGVPEGNPNDQLIRPMIPRDGVPDQRDAQLTVSGEYRFQRAFLLDGFWPVGQSPRDSSPITLELPGGRVEPLVWLHDYTERGAHPFLLRTPLPVPAGSLIRGLRPGVQLALLPAPAAP